jgi:hypothetical protein
VRGHRNVHFPPADNKGQENNLGVKSNFGGSGNNLGSPSQRQTEPLHLSPLIHEDISITPITVIISQELHKKLQELTDQKNISLSEWVRDAINQKLENY